MTGWRRMEILKMSVCKFDGKAMQYFAQCTWPCLRFLDLSYNDLDAKALDSLFAAELPELCVLDISRNCLGPSKVSIHDANGQCLGMLTPGRSCNDYPPAWLVQCWP